MKWNAWLTAIASGLLAGACSSPEMIVIGPDYGMELREMDTLVVSAERPAHLRKAEDVRVPPYQPSVKREHDLLHMDLTLAFNWAESTVDAEAELQFRPYFFPARQLVLDARNFTIHQVVMPGAADSLPAYRYDGRKLEVDLGRIFTREERFTLRISYTAAPGGDQLEAAGAPADRGLYFINPDGSEGDKPRQVWSHGETAWNSYWFPTIDQPNERFTHAIRLIVPDSMQTLSNGVLREQQPLPEGMRSDLWVMDQPHAPYLVMVAAGEWAIARDTIGTLPLAYYVEPSYAAYAEAIFGRTPEMITFFSNLLGTPFPWKKYAQIAVRDFVSGAMENTTASVFNEFVQKEPADLIDNHNDWIVAHELVHQWFGDLVTCESWANLTLNEGLASYGEYLWMEHYYGLDAADFHLQNEWDTYLGAAALNTHSLIHFQYEDEESMFDAHSYDKGGAVMHMLRYYLGDEAFFAGLRLYLEKNAYSSVEAHHLRLAFEAVSGEDLNWFFDQWFFSEGHPVLEVDVRYDTAKAEVTVILEQIQDLERFPPVFRLPLDIDIYLEGRAERQFIVMDRRRQEFVFPAAVPPSLVILDPNHTLLAEISYPKEPAELLFQYRNGRRYADRQEAVNFFAARQTEHALTVMEEALDDPFWSIRAQAVDYFEGAALRRVAPRLEVMALEDDRTDVRAAALRKLAEVDKDAASRLAGKCLQERNNYRLVGAALEVTKMVDPVQALAYARQLEDLKSEAILLAIADLYAESADTAYLGFFAGHLEDLNGYAAYFFYSHYEKLAEKATPPTAFAAMQQLAGIALDPQQSPVRRQGATRAVNAMRNFFRLEANLSPSTEQKEMLEQWVGKLTLILDEIKEKETNRQLKAWYRQLPFLQKNQ